MKSIIVLVSNLFEISKNCIESIKKYTNDYELILVADEKVEFTDYLLEKGKVIQPTESFSFPRYANIGIENSKGEHIFILNNDVVVTPDWAEKMIDVQGRTSGGIIGARTGRQCCGNPDAWGTGGIKETNFPINFFCVLIPRRVYEIVGSFDERFNQYGCEDDDYYIRARKHCFKSYIADVFVEHLNGCTFKGQNKNEKLLTAQKMFFKKWGIYPTQRIDDIKPTISVILPTYNRAEYIKDAVESIKNQTYSNWELIIVDDGSTDDTEKIVSGCMDDKIKYFQRTHQGANNSRNFGIKQATGEFITLMDSDDISLPQRLEKSLQVFQDNPNIDVVYTEYQICDADLNVISNVQHSRKWSKEEYLNREFNVAGGTFLMRRYVFDKVGLYDLHYENAFDFDWILRADEKGMNFVYIPEPLLSYRRHSDNQLAGNKKSHQQHKEIKARYEN